MAMTIRFALAFGALWLLGKLLGPDGLDGALGSWVIWLWILSGIGLILPLVFGGAMAIVRSVVFTVSSAWDEGQRRGVDSAAAVSLPRRVLFLSSGARGDSHCWLLLVQRGGAVS